MSVRLGLSFLCASGWWDEGHMLIASVARTWLTEPPPPSHNTTLLWTSEEGQAVVAKFDKVFSDWQSDFPQFTNLISAAVWADHIKCESRSAFCENPYGIQIFNENHFVDIFYNRTMPPAEQRQHIIASTQRKDNASFLLRSIHDSLIQSSNFTTNLLVRLFIHVFGDIHQPLHTMVYRGDCFPTGDRGGNSITIAMDHLDVSGSAESPMPLDGGPRSGEIHTLHGLWDSGGWMYSRSYPEFTVMESNQLAADLIKRHPQMTFHNYREAIEESYSMAERVYGDVIPKVCDGNATHRQVYTVTPEYLAMVRQLSERRVAAAGFSLAFYLYEFASKLDDVVIKTGNLETNDQDSLMGSVQMHAWMIYSVFITALFLFVLHRYNALKEQRMADTVGSRSVTAGSRRSFRPRSLKNAYKTNDSLSCGGTSDNLSDRLMVNQQDNDVPFESLPPPRILISSSNVTVKPRQ